MADYSYLGSGKIYLKEVAAAAAMTFIGNCSALAFAVTEDVKELKDFTQPGGGTYNEVKRISSVECQITAHDISAANLARALYGAATAVTSAAVTDQAMGAGYIGQFLPFPSMAMASPAPVINATNGDTATTRANSTAVALNDYLVPATPNGFFYKVTTAGTTAGSPPTFGTTVGGTTTDGTATLTCMGRVTLTLNTDYEVNSNGITILTGAAFTDGQPLRADFTKSAADVVQALVNSGKEYELYFDGLNEARSGKRTVIHAYRVKLGALANLALIGEDYAAMEMAGKLLKDSSKTGGGVSQYFKVEIEA